jgi:HlyD family secretion protein
MKRRRIAIMIAAIVAAGLIYYFKFYLPGLSDSEIKASGHVEVTEVDMSFRIPGHVAKIFVDEGMQPRKGEALAELDQEVLKARRDQADAQVRELEAREASLAMTITMKEEVLDAEINRAKAGFKAADARYQSLKTGSREQEIAEAAAARDRAKFEWENRERDSQRMKELFASHIVSESQYDAARTSADAAAAAYKAASERYKLVKAGPRDELVLEGKANLAGSSAGLVAAEAGHKEVEKLKLDLKALKAQRDQAKALFAIAEEDLKKSCLYAPFDGFVTVKDIEEGEYVQAGTPVLTVAQLDEVWVKTYVPETQLGKVYLGQKGEVISDTFPNKTYPGTVTYISPEAEFTPKNVQTKEERVKLVYRIKVTLQNPKQELKAGMPVDVILK